MQFDICQGLAHASVWILDLLAAVYTEAGELQRREPARRELLRRRPHKY